VSLAEAERVRSRLYTMHQQRHSHSMNILAILIELLFEIARAILIEAISGRVRRIRFRRGPQDIQEIRKRLHVATRRNLLNRLSTGERQ